MPSRKGSPNKNKTFLLNRLQDMYGEDFHPILRMAENAAKLQDILDIVPKEELGILIQGMKASIDAWDKIAQYTEPKLKAIEVSGGTDDNLTIKLVNYADNDT